MNSPPPPSTPLCPTARRFWALRVVRRHDARHPLERRGPSVLAAATIDCGSAAAVDSTEVQQKYGRSTAEVQQQCSRMTVQKYSRSTAEVRQKYSRSKAE
eukprot:2051842-Lingulodinium_polyedra.AAC.1